MKLQTKLLCFLTVLIFCANCDVISVNKADIIPPKTTPETKAEFSFTEKDFFTLKKEVCPEDDDKSDATEPSGIVEIDKGGKHLLVIDDKSEKEMPE